jgi:membrane associated rhomboid family serine protease
MFGGRPVSGTVVTWWLIAINVLCYLAEVIYSPQFVNDGVMVGRFGHSVGVANGQWYRLISSAFLHEPPGNGIGILHILFNMWALFIVGPPLERALGRARFLTVYLASALAGSVLFYLVGPPAEPALGASGAIFGLFGAWFVVARRLRIDPTQIVVLIVLNLVITFTVSGIAWQAHVGGLIAGTALTASFVYAPRANRALIQVSATVVLAVILAAAVVARDHQLAGAVLA